MNVKLHGNTFSGAKHFYRGINLTVLSLFGRFRSISIKDKKNTCNSNMIYDYIETLTF